MGHSRSASASDNLRLPWRLIIRRFELRGKTYSRTNFEPATRVASAAPAASYLPTNQDLAVRRAGRPEPPFREMACLHQKLAHEEPYLRTFTRKRQWNFWVPVVVCVFMPKHAVFQAKISLLAFCLVSPLREVDVRFPREPK